jgi:VCBS repeat-containing protein
MASDIVLKDSHVELVGDVRVVKSENGSTRIELDVDAANITLGGDGQDGDLLLNDETGKRTVQISGGGGGIGQSARIILDGSHGTLTIKHKRGAVLARIGGQEGKADVLDLRAPDGKSFFAAAANGTKTTVPVMVSGQGGQTVITHQAVMVGRATRTEVTDSDIIFRRRGSTAKKVRATLEDLERRVAALERG